ncbi:hypothetical protein ACWENS_37915 [Streptomyces sp. NPDC004532]
MAFGLAGIGGEDTSDNPDQQSAASTRQSIAYVSPSTPPRGGSSFPAAPTTSSRGDLASATTGVSFERISELLARGKN